MRRRTLSTLQCDDKTYPRYDATENPLHVAERQPEDSRGFQPTVKRIFPFRVASRRLRTGLPIPSTSDRSFQDFHLTAARATALTQ
jgi:hypothetical protein